MSYAEFPHTNYSDMDFHELIAFYKEVKKDYEGTLNSITELSNRLDSYEATVNERINSTVELTTK